MPAANLAHHPPGRRHHPRLELPRRQRSRPCIENLQHVGTGLHLARQVLDRRLDQQIDQPPKTSRIAIGPQPRLALVGRALPLHHVARHRPRRAAKADERRLPRQILPQPRDRFADERELGPSRVPAQAPQIRRAAHGVETRPLTLDEGHLLAQRIGHHEDVGEQDRRVEAEAPDRLQCHLGRQRRRVAQIEEAAGFRSHGPVLGQVSPRLPHQPDWRWRHRLAGERSQEAARAWFWRQRHR